MNQENENEIDPPEDDEESEAAEGEPYYDANGKLIPAEAFENEPSYRPLNLGEEEAADFDAETARMLEQSKQAPESEGE
jgi:hypothetical protein